MRLRLLATTAVLAVVLLGSCTRTTNIGDEFFLGDLGRVFMVDTFSVMTTTVSNADKVEAYRPLSPYNVLFTGQYSDDYFGTITAASFAQFHFFNVPNFVEGEIDSVVLSLAYRRGAHVGDSVGLYNIRVFELTDTMPRDSSFYSDRTFAYDPNRVVIIMFQANPNDSVSYLWPRNGKLDTLRRAPQLRITLSETFGNKLMNIDTAFYSTKAAEFLNQFKGLAVVPSGPQDGIIGFDYNNIETNLTVFYHRPNDTIVRTQIYDSRARDARFTSVVRQDAGSKAREAVNNTAIRERVYVGGFEGTDMKIEFPTVSNLKGKVSVHKAEIELYALDSAGLQQPVAQALMASKVGPDTVTLIDDSFRGATTGQFSISGGQPTKVTMDGQTVYKYTLIVTAHAQSLVDDANASAMLLTKFLRMQMPRSTVFFGSDHPTLAPKLRLYCFEL